MDNKKDFDRKGSLYYLSYAWNDFQWRWQQFWNPNREEAEEIDQEADQFAKEAIERVRKQYEDE